MCQYRVLLKSISLLVGLSRHQLPFHFLSATADLKSGGQAALQQPLLVDWQRGTATPASRESTKMRFVVQLFRPLGRELVFIVPLLVVIWFGTAFLSRNNRYSHFYGASSVERMRQNHRMYAETAQKAWQDMLAYTKEQQISRIFDRSDEFCVGVLSMARTVAPERRYLTTLMASLATRIPWHLQSRVSIRIFVMDRHPELHTEATEMGRLFRVVKPAHPDNISIPEEGRHGHYIAKEALDYLAAMRALEHCRYALLLEDDALAAHDWFAKTEELLGQIKDANWLYLKLFAPFTWMGWSKDGIGHIVTLVALGLSGALVASFLLATFLDGQHSAYEAVDGDRRAKVEPRFASPLGTLLMLPFFIVLFHCIGRQHLFPFTRGVHAFPLNASMVATLYPRGQLQRLANHFEHLLRSQSASPHPRYDAKDIIPTAYKRANNLVELIAVPSVFQHTGIHSSLGFKGINTERQLCVATNFEDDGSPIVFDRQAVERR